MKTRTTKILILSKIILGVILGVYLTKLISVGNEMTIFSQIFYYTVLIILSIGIINFTFVKSKHITNKNKVYLSIIALGLSLVLVKAMPDLSKLSYVRMNLTIESVESENSDVNTSEVWITKIDMDGKMLDLSKINLPDKWEFREGNVLTAHKGNPLTLELPFLEKASISFVMHPWSGSVKIDTGEQVTYKQLYTETSGEYLYDIQKDKYLGIKNGDYIIAILALAILIYMILALARTKRIYYALAYFLIGNIVFIYSYKIHLSVSTKILILLITIIVAYFYYYKIPKERLVYFTQGKLNKVALGIVTTYIGVVCLLNPLFVENGKIILESTSMSIAVLFLMWLIPLEIVIIFIIDKIAESTQQKNKDNRNVFRIWMGSFSILMVLGLIYWTGFYPGNMSQDSIGQWQQAIGEVPLNDWHPAGHTLILSVLVKVIKHPAFLSFIQIVFMSTIMACCFVRFYQKGLSAKVVLWFAVLFGIMPNNGVNIVTLWKDIPYAITLVWLTYLMMKFISNKRKVINNKIWLTCLSIALVLVTLLRHNGIVVVVFMVFAIGGYCLKNKNFKPIIVLVATMLIIIGIKGPGYRALQVTPNSPGVKMVSPIHDIAGVLYYYGDVADGTLDFMEDILPQEKWGELYSHYSANSYMFGNEYDFVGELGDKGVPQVLRVYLDNFIHNPIAIIYNRLSGTNLLWDITQPIHAYNYRYCSEIIPNDYGLYKKPNILTPVLNKVLHGTAVNPLLDTLIWRSGIYLVGILLIVYYWIIKRKWNNLYLLIPLVANIFSLLLSMSWQDYRYVYFVFLIFFIIFSYTISDFED